MSVPTECQGIQDEIESLQADVASLQQELAEASPSEKASILRQIRAVAARLGGLGHDLEVCIGNFPPPSPPSLPPPLELVFDGTAKVTTTYASARGPFVKPLRFTAVLNSERTVIAITSYLSITTDAFDTPFGLNVTTVTRTGGGTGSYAKGRIVVPLTLRFDQSIDVPFFEEDSNLSVTLTTDPPGSPVSAEPYGRLTLVGTGRFDGGVLGGSDGTLTIAGSFAAPVPTTVPDVRELRRVIAEPLVHAAGLRTHLVGATHAPNAWVYSQSPKADTIVIRGSAVTLNLKSEPIP